MIKFALPYSHNNNNTNWIFDIAPQNCKYKLRNVDHAHRQNVDLWFEAIAIHFLINRGDNPVEPSGQQYATVASMVQNHAIGN